MFTLADENTDEGRKSLFAHCKGQTKSIVLPKILKNNPKLY